LCIILWSSCLYFRLFISLVQCLEGARDVSLYHSIQTGPATHLASYPYGFMAWCLINYTQGELYSFLFNQHTLSQQAF
jgi:hypothetical protein